MEVWHCPDGASGHAECIRYDVTVPETVAADGHFSVPKPWLPEATAVQAVDALQPAVFTLVQTVRAMGKTRRRGRQGCIGMAGFSRLGQ